MNNSGNMFLEEQENNQIHLDGETLANRLKNVRLQRKFSQEHLAEQINVSQKTISNWENNISTPQCHDCINLANVLNIPLSILLKGEFVFETSRPKTTPFGKDIAAITGTNSLTKIEERFDFCEKETTLLIPVKCVKKFLSKVKNQLNSTSSDEDITDTFNYMQSFLIKWYKINRLNDLFSKKASISDLLALQKFTTNPEFLTLFKDNYPTTPGITFRNALLLGNKIISNEKNNRTENITEVATVINEFIEQYDYDLSRTGKNYR